MIAWNSRFETGLDPIDTQHRALFEAVNQLAESYRSGEAHARVTESLDFLVAYVQEHFRDEERFMREMAYPGLSAHVEEHAELARKVEDLLAGHAEGRLMTMAVTILLADWLSHHIETVDMLYMDFLKDKKNS